MPPESDHVKRNAEINHLMGVGEGVISFISESLRFLNLSANGMLNTPNMITVMTASNSVFEKILDHAEMPDEFRELIEEVHRTAELLIARHEAPHLSADELEAGLPLIFATNLIGIWGALESFVGDVFKISLRYRPDLLAGSAFKGVNLPVSVLANPEDDALYTAIYQKVLPPGTGAFEKFEDLLKDVDLRNIGVDPEVKKKLRAAHQIRNVWAHKSGIADSHFVTSCPYLPYKVGERVDLDQEAMGELAQAIVDYITLILQRLHKRFEDDGAVSPSN
ncbi:MULTISPECIES: hypothetical protein [Nocardia]|uniref:RiboL-PSP-HEPN domain-containing protein n=1 Tax=Nocardia nova TaxID=37330 RepID=A0A2T2ZDL7_9NOCA|nr:MULTISPECIES: hypothetical protein [Nocardia]PSR65868.1 hypothetical protein C8259_00305 [Nocardia nova]